MFGPRSAEISKVGGDVTNYDCVVVGLDDGQILRRMLSDKRPNLLIEVVNTITSGPIFGEPRHVAHVDQTD